MQEQVCQDGTLEMADEQTVERVAKAIWDEIRELEDRCDMEWDDMPSDHVHFVAARAAIAAMPDTKALEAADRLAERAHVAFDWIEMMEGKGNSSASVRLKNALAAYHAARSNKP